MPEYCGVISKNPVTHGNYERVASEARRFDYSILDEAVKNSVFVNVDEIDQDVSEIGQMEIVSDLSSGDYTVIDIRQSDDCIKTQVETIKIPFYKLKSEFKKLPQDKRKSAAEIAGMISKWEYKNTSQLPIKSKNEFGY